MRNTNFNTKNRRAAYQLLKDASFKKFKLNRSNVDAQDENKVCVDIHLNAHSNLDKRFNTQTKQQTFTRSLSNVKLC